MKSINKILILIIIPINSFSQELLKVKEIYSFPNDSFYIIKAKKEGKEYYIYSDCNLHQISNCKSIKIGKKYLFTLIVIPFEKIPFVPAENKRRPDLGFEIDGIGSFNNEKVLLNAIELKGLLYCKY